METHYDPAYDRSSRKDGRTPLGTVELPGLDPADQEAAADAVAEMAARWR